MKFTIDKHEKYTVFTPHKKTINSDVSPALKSELIALHTEGVNCLVLDLSEVTYIDSSGLSALLVGNRLFEQGKFVLIGLSEHVTKLVNISQLSTILKIFPTLDEAIKNVLTDTA